MTKIPHATYPARVSKGVAATQWSRQQPVGVDGGKVCLSHLHDCDMVSWRQRMEDPISEWGQLLAYLPAIRRFIGEHDSRVIFLPVPTLANDRNVHPPKEFIGRIARSRGQSVAQVRRDALEAMRDWEANIENDPVKYTSRLLPRRSKP